ncbi:hypothetical protein [Planctobacterium marinum]|uniref:LRAT domain-containing protein n=1 Tax=Planctobacterium marinum TaxID=1631968 RepID=A0AA48KPM9_9ALTE|nr:hypothetical protein MACH26_23320 [Planctobacterium marinum]
MALPLLWLGAAAAATLAGIKYSNKISQHRGYVDVLPGESSLSVKPLDGAVVCCEVYGVLDHTGIWFDDGVIELNGNGLIRSISAERFLADRSGEEIFIACDTFGHPLIAEHTHTRAVSHLYQYRDYDLLNNNCHRFVWQAVSGVDEPINRFGDLNQHLSLLHQSSLSWLKMSTN